MVYRHTKDINPDDTLDAKNVDDQVTRVVEPLAIAFERSSNLDNLFRHLVADQLRQFLSTHKSIRLLVSNRGENLARLADAMSLAREQIEKVFVIALLLEDPQAWTRQYFKDDWRRHFERYLLDKDERSNLERHKEFIERHAHDSIENERKEIGITEEEREFVKFKHYNKGIPTPLHLKPAAKTMEHFPTPAKVIDKVKEAQLADVLRRWHREYSYFSGYSHAGFHKLMPKFIESSKKLTTSQREKVIETEYDPALFVSYLAIASACTEASVKYLPCVDGSVARVADVELLVKLDELWAVMRRSALLGKALWELRVRHIMPPLLGT
ncbi:MAG: DUF5677 domain-containing protein [Rubrobacteraceae bacterium]